MGSRIRPRTLLRMRRIEFLDISLGGVAVAAGLRPGLRTRFPSSSLDEAYAFLDNMMDLYVRGTTTRLVQSFVPTRALQLGDIAYTYDSALVVIAFLQRATSDDLARATVLGDSFLYAQAHDPAGDGRIRNGYHVDPFLRKNGTVRIAFGDGDGGTDAGNMAWTGLALAHLAAKTGAPAYLDGAAAIGEWVQVHCYDTRGAGGYTAGLSQRGNPLPYKATEHNVDLYALFTMLTTLTGDSAWSQRAAWARQLVEAMWSASSGFFWTGTTADGVTINRSFVPEDCQSWSYLALQEPAHAGSLDWAYANLSATDGPFSGVAFSNADRSGVWFEGTAHMAAAFEARNASGDGARAQAFLQTIGLAQTEAPNEDGMGIDAASKDGLRTGDGDKYYAALHIGATAWYCIALQSGNPMQLVDRRRRRRTGTFGLAFANLHRRSPS